MSECEKFYIGPCLLTADQAAIDDCYKTAERLAAIDKDIRFRCKLWGGGTRPDRYVEGIGDKKGFPILLDIENKYFIGNGIGIEIRDGSNFVRHKYDRSWQGLLGVKFYWIAARSAQNYDLLREMSCRLSRGDYGSREILIKRNPGCTIDEIIGIHDICEKIHGYKPMIVERGINTFCRTEKQRWMPDFQGMLRIIQERPDIELCFDPSHACGVKEHIFPTVRAAYALGVRNYMLEVMNDPSLSQTDKTQILSIEEFEEIYKWLKKRGLIK